MLLTLILLYLNWVCYHMRRGMPGDRTLWFIQASAVWGILLLAVTEGLSAFRILNQGALWAVWLGLAVLLGVWLVRQHPGEGLRALGRRRAVPWGRAALYLPMAGIGLTAVGFSLAVVPYNWDSMTYHVSRIAHWAQNRSAAHYATNIIRQITSPVLAEFVNAHVYIMTGQRDILLNLLQAGSYLACAWAVWQIARKLGCRPGLCCGAVILYMTMPTAFAEAMTTQVDNFATVWLLYFVYILLDFARPEEKIGFSGAHVGRVCTLGVLVALGYLTKPSVCIAMAVLLVWLLVMCLCRKDNAGCLCRLALCAAPAVALPILPELARNFVTFSAFSAPIAGPRQLVGTLRPLYLLINMIKNATYNLPSRYFPQLSQFLLRAVRKGALVLGVDLNQETISENGQEFFYQAASDYGQDTANNPIILYFMMAAAVMALLFWIKRKGKGILFDYFPAALACFLVFCTVLRWEPYVSRYMVSYLALLCPAIACQLQRISRDQVRWAWLGILFFVSFVEFLGMIHYHRTMCVKFQANLRPQGYYAMRTTEYAPYSRICLDAAEKGYERIGLLLTENDYEYPLWCGLKGTAVRIEHVCVENESRVYADETFVPDCVIGSGGAPGEAVVIGGQSFAVSQEYEGGYYLLERESWGQ